MVKIEFFPEPENVKKYQINNFYKCKHTLSLPEDSLLVKGRTIKRQIFRTVKPISFPNRTVLGEEFTDDDYEKLCSKLLLQHEQFKKHQLRDVKSKVERTKATFNHLTTEEIFTALKNFDYNEDEVLLYLTKNEFITQIRNQIAQSHPHSEFNDKLNFEKETENFVMKDNRKISDNAKESEENENKEENEISNVKKYRNGDLSSGSSDDESNEIYTRRNQIHQSLSMKSVAFNKKTSRLKLDDALVNASDMDGWSEARMKAYQAMKKNPNTYYYRFNAPGETQRNGSWLKEEDELFMKRLGEVGADGQWGIFSIAIPGRVGYQCSNYYRKLVEIGRIKDTNYRVDEKGKAHFISGKPRIVTKLPDGEILENDEFGSDVDGSFNSESETYEKEIIYNNKKNNNINNLNYLNSSLKTINTPITNILFHENPLPGFIDTITKTEIVRPAISPYGHVLSYDTWLKCLLNSDRKNTCPLTNQPLHKRQLIFLTFENIELYRDRIRQIND